MNLDFLQALLKAIKEQHTNATGVTPARFAIATEATRTLLRHNPDFDYKTVQTVLNKYLKQLVKLWDKSGEYDEFSAYDDIMKVYLLECVEVAIEKEKLELKK